MSQITGLMMFLGGGGYRSTHWSIHEQIIIDLLVHFVHRTKYISIKTENCVLLYKRGNKIFT